jgi:Fe-S-cluster containining protein
LLQYLSAEEFAHYKSLIGADNWCTHFDKENRVCTIYDTRPEFCKVDPKKYKKMFGVDEEDLNVSVEETTLLCVV